MKKIFIAGTDTDVGKTYTSVALLHYFNAQGLKTIAHKPLASGSEKDAAGELRNSDALALQAAASVKLPYTVVNPFCFEPPIAPHVAASRIGLTLQLSDLDAHFKTVQTYPADLCLVEGAGGWHTPVNEKTLLSDWVVHQGFSVILVVKIKLGCLNHTILTAQAIEKTGLPFLGWIANCMEPNYSEIDSSIVYLKNYLKAPCLNILAHSGGIEELFA